MKLKEAIEILQAHNVWRRGIYEAGQTNPKLLGIAIDTIVKEYNTNQGVKMYSKATFLKAAKLGEVSMIDAKHIVSLLDEVKQLKNKKK